MKLSIINEYVSQRDFYDFYLLVHASYDSPDHDIIKYATVLGKQILLDHLDQIGNIIYQFLCEFSTEHKQINNLSIEEKQKIIAQLTQHCENKSKSDGPGETWIKIAKWYSNIKIPNTLDNIISTIDNIYNMCHNSGSITTHMLEGNWLERALHTRQIANPAQLMKYASANVRQIVGRTIAIGYDRSEISELQRIEIAFHRIESDSSIANISTDINTNLDKPNNILTVNGKVKYKQNISEFTIELHENTTSVSVYNNNTLLLNYKKPIREYGSLVSEIISRLYNIAFRNLFKQHSQTVF